MHTPEFLFSRHFSESHCMDSHRQHRNRRRKRGRTSFHQDHYTYFLWILLAQRFARFITTFFDTQVGRFWHIFVTGKKYYALANCTCYYIRLSTPSFASFSFSFLQQLGCPLGGGVLRRDVETIEMEKAMGLGWERWGTTSLAVNAVCVCRFFRPRRFTLPVMIIISCVMLNGWTMVYWTRIV
jgi:hypothetical protein